MTKIILLSNTIKYLKFKQIYFSLFYFFRNKYKRTIGFNYLTFENTQSNKLILQKAIYNYESYKGNNNFNFLNQRDIKRNDSLLLIKNFSGSIKKVFTDV